MVAEGNVSFGGVEMGATNATGIWWDTLTGLTDLPRLIGESQPPARLHDPAVPAWADIGWRQITAEGIHVDDDTKMLNVRGAMSDRRNLKALTFRDSLFSDDDLMVWAMADRCEFPRNAVSHNQRAYVPSLQWLAADPSIFSAAETDLSFGGGGSPVAYVDLAPTNEGTFATPSGRAWRLRITAHGNVERPYIRRGPTVGNWEQSITWHLNMTGGQVLELDVNRSSWIGALGVDGLVMSDDDDFPNWPILEHGANAFRVGCVSGTISGNLFYRSSW